MEGLSVQIEDLKTMKAELIQSQKETDAQFKETDARFKDLEARFKETDAQFKKTDKRIKEAFELFEGQWGKLMESLVEGDLIKILNERGIKIRDTSTRRKGHYEEEQYEFDIIAHNGEGIIVVEVKTTLRVKDVKKHINRLKKIKTWIPEYKGFKVYGAVAFLRAEEESDVYADKKKLFVIRATGDSAAIVNEEDFVPKAF